MNKKMEITDLKLMNKALDIFIEDKGQKTNIFTADK